MLSDRQPVKDWQGWLSAAAKGCSHHLGEGTLSPRLQDKEILLPTKVSWSRPETSHAAFLLPPILMPLFTGPAISPLPRPVPPGLPAFSLPLRANLHSATWITCLGPLPAQYTCRCPSILSTEPRALCMARQALPSPASVCLPVSASPKSSPMPSPQVCPTCSLIPLACLASMAFAEVTYLPR